MEYLVIGIIIFVILCWIGSKSGGSGYNSETQTPGTTLDHKGRRRCNGCGKVSYDGYPTASRVANNAGKYGKYLRAYQDPKCGNWHLSSQRPR